MIPPDETAVPEKPDNHGFQDLPAEKKQGTNESSGFQDLLAEKKQETNESSNAYVFQEMRARQKQERQEFQERRREDGSFARDDKTEGFEMLSRQKQERQEFHDSIVQKREDLNPRKRDTDDFQTSRRVDRDFSPKQDDFPAWRKQDASFERSGDDTDKSILAEMRIQTDLLKQIADKEGLS